MLGTSFVEWILIRLSILLFRYTPLLYITALAALTLTFDGSSAWHLAAICIFCGLLFTEGLFYVLFWRPYRARLAQAAVHPTPLTSGERRALLDRCLLNIPSLESYLKWWFLGAALEDIRRDNLTEFLLWAFFDHDEVSLDMDEGAGAVREELDEYIAMIEQRLGRELEDGRGPAKCLRLTLDGIETSYRSLAWYGIIFVVDQVTHLALAYHGFQYYASSQGTSRRTFPPRPQQLIAKRRSPASNLSYWYQPHHANGDGKTPIVFFHGIGVGLWTYVRFLADIHASKNRDGDGVGIIAVEILPVSFRLTSPPLDKTEFLSAMASIVDYHGWNQFSIVSHSYGSVLTTHMLHCPAMQSRVTSVVLIDPVTIMLHLPDVAYNFTRRRPKRANEWQLWYFASTDPGVAHCLGRHFFWQQNIIWKEELVASPCGGREARKAAVCLSGRDLIVDTFMVKQYLLGEGQQSNGPDAAVEVLLFPELDHAQVFDDPTCCIRLVSLVKSYC